MRFAIKVTGLVVGLINCLLLTWWQVLPADLAEKQGRVALHFEDAPINYEEQWAQYQSGFQFKEVLNTIVAEDTYCEKVEEYRRMHPVRLDSRGLPVQEDRVMYTSFPFGYYIRTVFKETQNLVLKRNVEQVTLPDAQDAQLPYNITCIRIANLQNGRIKVGINGDKRADKRCLR